MHGPASGRRNSTADGFHEVLSLLGWPLQHRWPRDPEDAGEARDEFGGVAMFGATVQKRPALPVSQIFLLTMGLMQAAGESIKRNASQTSLQATRRDRILKGLSVEALNYYRFRDGLWCIKGVLGCTPTIHRHGRPPAGRDPFSMLASNMSAARICLETRPPDGGPDLFVRAWEWKITQ